MGDPWKKWAKFLSDPAKWLGAEEKHAWRRTQLAIVMKAGKVRMSLGPA